MPQRGASLRRFSVLAACAGLLIAGAALLPTVGLARGPDSVADVAEGFVRMPAANDPAGSVARSSRRL